MEYLDNAKFRAIVEWPAGVRRTPASQRRSSPFKATYGKTLMLLRRELDKLGAKNIYIEADCNPSQIRRDGYPRADARFNGPGVIISFDSKFGPMYFPCDTFENFEDNMRAIALSLENLRAVDRYGVTKRGEQYTGGFQRLAPGSGQTMGVVPALSLEQAARVLAASGWGDAALSVDASSVLEDAVFAEECYRFAAKRLHPDVAGEESAADWQRLQEAIRVIRKHHGR